MIIYAGTHGYCDPVPLEEMRRYERDLLTFMHTQHSQIVDDIIAQEEITEETEAKLQTALEEFNQAWVAASEPVEAEG